MKCRTLAIGLLLVARVVVAEGEWGTLTMRFVYDSEPPKTQAIVVDKDKEYCGRKELVAEALVVHATNRGIANVLVWIEPARDEKLPVHPSYDRAAKADVVMAFQDCRCSPHIALVRSTQTLKVENHDKVAHAPVLNFFANSSLANSRTLPTGAHPMTWTFQMGEFQPAHLQCAIHPWISGYVLVRDNPYMAVSDATGKLTIANLPVGRHDFRVWQESAGLVKAASREGKPVEWPRGRASFEVKPGENDLGEFKLLPATFRR